MGTLLARFRDVRRRHVMWVCNACGAENHEIDAECAFCDAHEHSTKAEDYNAASPDGPQKCSRCGDMYGGPT